MDYPIDLSISEIELVDGAGTVTQQQYTNCVTFYTTAGTIMGGVLGGGVGAAIGGIAGAWYGASGACPAVGSYN